MKNTLTDCPVCDRPLSVTRLNCDHCGTIIEGNFVSNAGPFAQLSPEQTNFALTFIRCEGRLNRMEDELKLSYPTLRNRLIEVIRALGFEPGKEEQPVRLSTEERAKILDDMSEGKITYETARRLLTGEE
jgi:hypothetical protein